MQTTVRYAHEVRSRRLTDFHPLNVFCRVAEWNFKLKCFKIEAFSNIFYLPFKGSSLFDDHRHEIDEMHCEKTHRHELNKIK